MYKKLRLIFPCSLFFLLVHSLECSIPFPSSGFTQSEQFNWSFWADFTYLEVTANHLSFIESGNTKKNGDVELSSLGETYYPSFCYNPGFKVGFALDLMHDNWDLSGSYAWLNGSGGPISVNSTYANSTLVETRQIFLPLIDRVVKADADFDYLLQSIDLSLGKNFYLSPFLTSRPHAGLYGLLDTTLSHVHYTSHTNTFLDGHFISQIYKQKFFGIGLRSGLDLDWQISKNWSILSYFSAMNLWSKFNIEFIEKTYEIALDKVLYDEENILYNSKGSFWALQNGVSIGLGLKWHLAFDHHKKSVEILGLWNQQVLINHIQQPIATRLSNLNIQGLDLQLRFNF